MPISSSRLPRPRYPDSKTCIAPLFLSTKMYSQSQSQSQSRSTNSRRRSTARSGTSRTTSSSHSHSHSHSRSGRRRTDNSKRGQTQSRSRTRPTRTKSKNSSTSSSYHSRSRSRTASHPAADHAAGLVEEQSDLYTSYPPPQRQDTSTVSLQAPPQPPPVPLPLPLPLPLQLESSAAFAPSNTRQIKNGVATGSAATRSQQTRRPQPRTRRLISRTALLASRVASKRQLTLAFSITFVVTGIIYLALFLTHTIQGVLFHVLSIILLLSLLAVAVHSGIRWVMIKEEYNQAKEIRDRKRKTPGERGWVIGRPYQVKIGGRPVEENVHSGQRSVLGDDEVPSQGMRVYMREDEDDLEAGLGGNMTMEDDMPRADDYNTRLRHDGADLADVLMGGGVGGDGYGSRAEGIAGPVRPHPAGPRAPPPVYGNFRTSVRMNPNHVYVQATPIQPTPITPTYAEAMSAAGAGAGAGAGDSGEARGPLLPGMAGYRPPSYSSEGGLTAVLEARRRGVEEAMGRIHPMEGERLGRMAFRG